MSLRRFIVLISSLVAAFILVVFYFETQKVLKTLFTHLDNIHARAVLSTSQGIIKAHAYSLNTYRTLLENDSQLSSLFLIAKLQGNNSKLSRSLSQLKANMGCDLLELRHRNGKPLFVGTDLILPSSPDQPRLLLTKVNGSLAMVSLSPLRNFGEIVGTVVLGYYVNGTISNEIANSTGSPIFFSTENAANQVPHKAVRNLEIDLHDGNPALRLTVNLDQTYMETLDRHTAQEIAAVSGGSLVLLLVLLYGLLELGFVRRFTELLNSIQSVARDLDLGKISDVNIRRQPIREVNALSQAFSKFSNSLRAFQLRIQEKSRKEAYAEIAEQVAHDLQSPLAAMDMSLMMETDSGLIRSLRIRECLDRVRGIINSLSDRHKIKNFSAPLPSLLSPILKTIVAEKMTQFSANAKLKLSLKLPDGAIWSPVASRELKRTLSNLIDNAVEASLDSGEITIQLTQLPNQAVIEIIDNGQGIPKERLPLLGTRGATFDKINGSGLGLFGAKELMKSIGGSLGIRSDLGVGTTVKLTLPTTNPPAALIDSLTIDDRALVVIVDDDRLIHETWERRLQPRKLQHFHNFDSFILWYRSHKVPILCLCDYEFKNETRNGIDLIQALELEQQAILVTGHVENETVMSLAATIPLRVLPKDLITSVPINNIGSKGGIV